MKKRLGGLVMGYAPRKHDFERVFKEYFAACVCYPFNIAILEHLTVP